MYFPIFRRHYFIKSIDSSHILLLTNILNQNYHLGLKLIPNSRLLNKSLKTLYSKKSFSPDISNFLSNAPKTLINDLNLSFYYHNYIDQKNVLNVETINWSELPFFAKELSSKLAKNRLRKSGKHQLNLRYGNIHLAVDYINHKRVSQIHWDNFYPRNLIEFIFHAIKDNVLN